MDVLNRAKIATQSKTDSALAEWLNVAQSVVSGYKRRQIIPLEQCIKIAEKTGVSLDWLILGRGDQGSYPIQKDESESKLDSDRSMLLTGWDYLNDTQREVVFNLIRRLARGEDTVKAVQQVINITGNVSQTTIENGSIENLNVSQ